MSECKVDFKVNWYTGHIYSWNVSQWALTVEQCVREWQPHCKVTCHQQCTKEMVPSRRNRRSTLLSFTPHNHTCYICGLLAIVIVFTAKMQHNWTWQRLWGDTFKDTAQRVIWVPLSNLLTWDTATLLAIQVYDIVSIHVAEVQVVKCFDHVVFVSYKTVCM